MAYSEKLLNHFKHPQNVGTLDKSSNKDNGNIEDAKFKTFGCGSAIASSSLATEWLKGKSLDEALAIDNMAIVEELALPPVKIHCSVLAEDAIKSAIKDYQKKNGLEVAPEAEHHHH